MRETGSVEPPAGMRLQPVIQTPGRIQKVDPRRGSFELALSSTPIVPIVVLFLKLPYGILSIILVKPKNGTAMETIGKP